MNADVRVSFNLFGLRAPDYLPVVEVADALGFDTVWLAEHLISPQTFDAPYPYSETGAPPYPTDVPLVDVWATLASWATRTERIRLGTGVYVLPLRPTLVTARAAATVQDLSGGRLAFGVGAGWLRAEFAAVGVGYDDRGARMVEQVAALRVLWGEQPASFDGEHVRFEDLVFAPPPVAPIPILVGGSSGAALRRAAILGDGWYGPDAALEESVAWRDRIEQLRREAGRGNEPFEMVVRLAGEPSTQLLERYARAGFGHVVTSLAHTREPGQPLTAAVERLAGVLGLRG